MAVPFPSPLRYTTNAEGSAVYAAPREVKEIQREAPSRAHVAVSFNIYWQRIYKPGYPGDLPSIEAASRTMLVKSNAETRDIGHLWYARKKFSFGRRGTKQYLQYCYAKDQRRMAHAQFCYVQYMKHGEVDEDERRGMRDHWEKDGPRLRGQWIYVRRIVLRFLLARVMRTWKARLAKVRLGEG
ncbi:hypothetical protein K523DRAFT_263336, partial [Schizophyllum commune Tattone D]